MIALRLHSYTAVYNVYSPLISIFSYFPLASWLCSFNHIVCCMCVSLHNKSVYFKIGLRKMMFRRSCKDLHQLIRLEVDGKLIDVPPVEGIIILNILRYLFCFSKLTNLLMYKAKSVYLDVCFFVPYTQPHISVDLDQIWHVASIHPKDGHGYGVGFLFSN